MTTIIRTSCPECGEVQMPASNIVVAVAPGGQEGEYRFWCPSCRQEITKRADKNIITLLLAEDTGVEGLGIDGSNWDQAFSVELSCDGTHRWDFPVKIGQYCLCGKEKWEK